MPRGLRSFWCAGFVVLAGSASMHSCIDQPKPHCTSFPAASGTYAMRVEKLSQQESAEGTCEALGVDPYFSSPEVGITPYFAKGSDGQPDYLQGSVGIQTAEIGDLIARAELSEVKSSGSGKPYALGKFSSGEPDDEGFCKVPELSAAHLVLPAAPEIPDDPDTEVPDGVPEQPAIDIELRWSDVELYVTPAILGTQFTAQLTDTRKDPAGESCTVKYRVLGLAPAVPCSKLDDKGEPVKDDAGKMMTDESLCAPLPPPGQDRALGSGISVGVAYRCDPQSFYCVLRKDKLPSVE
jgi:hypothetical protein